jgi:hypothetical protein
MRIHPLANLKIKQTVFQPLLYAIILIPGICFDSHAQSGCTDPLANNFDAGAIVNDGSCTYQASSISPVTSIPLAANLAETSGLIKWNGNLWTHNDNSDLNLYSLDTITGAVVQSYPLTGTVNKDWEEISQDSNYLYVGDFGNNVNGNRTDLQILRIEKNSLLAQTPVIDTIFFSYSDQTDFTPTGNNNTDFDCEAFVVTSDSIYLFTKQWVSNKTTLYVLPKIPGTHIAQLKTTFNVQGMITGAVLLQDERIISLCGYTNFLQPFTWLLYDFTGSEFFGANKRKISIPLPFHQIEGITTSDGLTFYATNENFTIVSTPQKLHIFDFTSYLSDYLDGLWSNVMAPSATETFLIYPNPATHTLYIKHNRQEKYILTNLSGETILSGILDSGISIINIEELSSGVYFLHAGGQKTVVTIMN